MQIAYVGSDLLTDFTSNGLFWCFTGFYMAAGHAPTSAPNTGKEGLPVCKNKGEHGMDGQRRRWLRLRDKGNLGSLPGDGRKPRRRFEGDRLNPLVLDWLWRPLQPVSAVDRTFGFQRPAGWGQRFCRRALARPR